MPDHHPARAASSASVVGSVATRRSGAALPASTSRPTSATSSSVSVAPGPSRNTGAVVVERKCRPNLRPSNAKSLPIMRDEGNQKPGEQPAPGRTSIAAQPPLLPALSRIRHAPARASLGPGRPAQRCGLTVQYHRSTSHARGQGPGAWACGPSGGRRTGGTEPTWSERTCPSGRSHRQEQASPPRSPGARGHPLGCVEPLPREVSGPPRSYGSKTLSTEPTVAARAVQRLRVATSAHDVKRSRTALETVNPRAWKIANNAAARSSARPLFSKLDEPFAFRHDDLVRCCIQQRNQRIAEILS